jgi:hypothetical protein
MGKEVAVIHFEFPSRLFGRQCVTFTGYRDVMANKAMCVWTDAVEVTQYRVDWWVFVDTFMDKEITM